MKKILIALVAAGVLSFAGATLVQAQDTNVGLFKAPFRFIVDGKLMPAGSYRVSSQGQGFAVLLIESTDRSAAAAFTSTMAVENPYGDSSQVHVEFKAIDGTYFLTQVALPGQDARRIFVTKANAEQVLAKLNLMPAEHVDAGGRQ